jgi:hypothetical protein
MIFPIVLRRGEKFECPKCGEEWESPIEDYTIPGTVGEASRGEHELCSGCNVPYTICRLNADEYEVDTA